MIATADNKKRARGAPKIALINQTTYKAIENV